jgi:hypothetical protein
MTGPEHQDDNRYEVIGPTRIVPGKQYAVYDFAHGRVAHHSNPDHRDDSHGGPLSCCLAPGRLCYFATRKEAQRWIESRA